MAKKKSTPEQEAIRAAYNKPTRKWFVGRRMAWVKGEWPAKWSFFTNWRGFSLSIGDVESASEKETAPKSVLLVSLDWRPFGFAIWWRSKRLVWIGDWEWKAALHEED